MKPCTHNRKLTKFLRLISMSEKLFHIRNRIPLNSKYFWSGSPATIHQIYVEGGRGARWKRYGITGSYIIFFKILCVTGQFLEHYWVMKNLEVLCYWYVCKKFLVVINIFLPSSPTLVVKYLIIITFCIPPSLGAPGYFLSLLIADLGAKISKSYI